MLSNLFEHYLAVDFHLQVLSLQDSNEETDEYEEYEVQQKNRMKHDDGERQRVNFCIEHCRTLSNILKHNIYITLIFYFVFTEYRSRISDHEHGL